MSDGEESDQDESDEEEPEEGEGRKLDFLPTPAVREGDRSAKGASKFDSVTIGTTVRTKRAVEKASKANIRDDNDNDDDDGDEPLWMHEPGRGWVCIL
jgi:hypothetical protein